MAGETDEEVERRPESAEQNHTEQYGIVDPDRIIKNPLQFQWTLGYQEPDKNLWEDEKNFRGSRWVINVLRQQRHELDKHWLDMTLWLIGKVVDNPEEICGAVVNIRQKMDKIAIWTSTVMNRDAPMPEKAVSRFLAIFEP
ncbi:eukaryotic translation initiation factor 4E-like [Uranotaenia lowii]|uniref:eukaryotic translation initiation factor 4E-like n=1 Tax=Uranotaenia lowii TaxID=190385 RepID=UPI0024799066|nr:eukaryotic translation initiation factor 4E-like [Uranotaenia lowii]XP_055590409.1 eukaryotic translation initiation factor 4E-like [Uranotaenia lowii]